jgi:hypothetical protein
MTKFHRFSLEQFEGKGEGRKHLSAGSYNFSGFWGGGGLESRVPS